MVEHAKALLPDEDPRRATGTGPLDASKDEPGPVGSLPDLTHHIPPWRRSRSIQRGPFTARGRSSTND